MTTITTRAGKGSPLTNAEMDANLTGLNDDKVEASGDSITGDLSFGDNNKAIFGAGSDLQIYHDGSNSYIDDTATGHLFIRSNGDGIYLRSNTNEEIAHFNVNGSVKAYYDNSLKLETTSTGIDVTGTVTADGLTVDASTAVVQASNAGGTTSFEISNTNGVSTANNKSALYLSATGSEANAARIESDFTGTVATNHAQDLKFYYVNTGSSPTLGMTLNSSGNLLVGKTNNTLSNDGTIIRAGGEILVTNTSDTAGTFNRLSTDGAIIGLYKDGSTVGSIGTANGDLHIDGDTGIRFQATSLMPRNGGSDSDGAIDLGLSSNRFKDLYLSNNIVASGASSPTLNLTDTTNNVNILVYAQDADAHVGTYSNHPLIFDTNSTERMRINSSGNVGIGTSNPAQPFVVAEGTNQRGIELLPGSLSYIQAYNRATSDYGDLKIDAQTIRFGTDNGSERMRIHSNGRVSIGSSPSSAAELFNLTATSGNGAGIEAAGNGNTLGSTSAFYGQGSGSDAYVWNRANSTILFATNNTECARFGSSGDMEIGSNRVNQGAGRYLDIYNQGTDSATFSILRLIRQQVASSTLTTSEFYARKNGETAIWNHETNSAAYLRAGIGVTEGWRIHSSGNVLLGKSSPAFGTAGVELNNAGAPGKVWITRSSGEPLALNRETNDGPIIEFYQGSGTQVGLWQSRGGAVSTIVLDPRSNGSGLTGSQLGLLPTNHVGSTTDGGIDLGSSSSRFRDIYLSGGAYLGGTAAANHLDDYEEGTWTPSYVASITNPTVSYDVINGSYTKVGRKVFCQFTIRTTGVTAQGSGNLQIGGLPFTSANFVNIYGACSLAFAYNFPTGNTPLTGYVDKNKTVMTFVRADGTDVRDGVSTGVSAANLQTGSAQNYVSMSFTYVTA